MLTALPDERAAEPAVTTLRSIASEETVDLQAIRILSAVAIAAALAVARSAVVLAAASAVARPAVILAAASEASAVDLLAEDTAALALAPAAVRLAEALAAAATAGDASRPKR